MDTTNCLLNLRRFEELAMLHMKSAEAANSSMSLIAANIDNLKAINDGYSLSDGDILIKQIADRLRVLLPENFLLGRFPGANVLILAPGYSKKPLFGLIDGIRQDLELVPVELSGNTRCSITVSFGLAEFPKDADSFFELATEAREQLGRAKRLGKNRVEPCNRTSCYGCKTGLYGLE